MGCLFNFFKKKKQTSEIVDLSEWEELLNKSDTWLGTIIDLNHIDDVGKALVHTDKKTLNRFMIHARGLHIDDELNFSINHYKNISKIKSDKAKNLIISMLKTKKKLIASSL